MSIQHLLTEVGHASLNTFDLLLRAMPAITIIFLSTLLIILANRWFRKILSYSTHRQQGNNNFNNLYDRIHNYQHNQPSPSSRPSSTAHNNASTDSNYHHAIKLLQETKTLVEYCNLTQGEAELLKAVYGSNSPHSR
jgi:hypothetical protein